MATRRIARGRGGSPVPIIILSVLLVGAVGLSIVLGMRTSEQQDAIDQVRGQMRQLEQRRTDEQTRFRQYETKVDLPPEPDMLFEVFEKWVKELAETHPLDEAAGGPRKLETVRDLLNAYAEACKDLKGQRDRLQRELGDAKAEREQLRANLAKANDDKVAAVNEQKKIAEGLRKDKADIQAQLDKATQDAAAKIEALTGEKTELIKDLNHWKKLAGVREEKIKDLEVRNEDLRRAKETMGELITPRAGEPVDGRIITVAADGETAMIDAGRQDWVAVGMEFEIYDNADPEARKSKGHIQVREVFDTIARCKVLRQDELDPILPGMVIVNAAFARGRNLNFVLVGKFKEPNLDQFLSRYPCQVVRTEKGEAKYVTRETDYVVLGGARVPPGEDRPGDMPAAQKARELKITVMTEDDLLRYLGELD